MKVHYREFGAGAIYCKRPPIWNLNITNNPDLVTCLQCLNRIKFQLTGGVEKAKFGTCVEIVEGDLSGLQGKNILLESKMRVLRKKLKSADECIRRALDIPEFDNAVSLVQHELMPYIHLISRSK